MSVQDNSISGNLPYHRSSSCFVSCNKECHHLVDEFLICEASGAESNGQDVNTCVAFLGQDGTLLRDQISADLFDVC